MYTCTYLCPSFSTCALERHAVDMYAFILTWCQVWDKDELTLQILTP